MRAKWTDLAVEACSSASKSDTERLACGMERLTVRIDSERDAQAMGRPCGVYVTLTCPQTMSIALKTRQALARELAMTLRSMLPKARQSILVVGLGNRNVTPDSLGPRTAERILVTRHMAGCLPEDMAQSMASVSAAAPGVLGVTGMETVEILKGMVTHVQPDAVIAIDALAARSSSRIASTIQIADTGITPGSGVGNHRKALNEQTLGVPVIAVGGAAGRLCLNDCVGRALCAWRRRGGGGAHSGMRRAGRFPQAGGNGGDAARGGCAGGAHVGRFGGRHQSGASAESDERGDCADDGAIERGRESMKKFLAAILAVLGVAAASIGLAEESAMGGGNAAQPDQPERHSLRSLDGARHL